MANAQVEKIKALGMRHGEKAGVAIAAAVFVVLLGMAVTKKTIDKTPEEVESSAKSAQTNLNRNEPREEILKKLEDEWLKSPGFVKIVEEQEKSAIDPSKYIASRAWVTQEPGAGLIRDQPELVTVDDLNAFPGRGGFLVFELDAKGKRIPEDPDKAKKLDDAAQKRRTRLGKRPRNRGGMGGSMMGGSMMGGGMGMGASGEETPEQKKAREIRDKQLQAQLAGKTKPDAEKGKDAEKGAGGADEPEKPSKEFEKGYRWVSITGTINHKKMKENWANALKYSTAAPNYSHLDVRRQALQSDGTWSDFEPVDLAKNRSIVFNLPEEEEELTPENVRIGSLVDPLPFLKAGLWQGVHVGSLVSQEKLDANKAPVAGGAGAGMMSGMGGGGMPGMGGSGMPGMGGSGMPGMGGGGMPGMGGGGMRGGMMGGGYGAMSGGMGGSGGGMGGGEENQDFQKTESETIMVRSLDFTVEPDSTYRFQVRIVVFNPNYNNDKVSPGTNTADLELNGPWSEPSEAVTMPPDVAAYAMAKTKTGQGAKARPDLVNFQVARWNPANGVTVVRFFDAGPGQIIGNAVTTQIPNSDGKPASSQLVDYNSRQIVIDSTGGPQPISGVGANGAPLDVPALSLMLRPDGSVMIRNQAFDYSDPVRKDIADNYKRELEESGKARESSTGGMGGGGYGGMMGGSGGGYGGMMGARRGGGR